MDSKDAKAYYSSVKAAQEMFGQMSGLEALQMMVDGEIPPPPIARTLSFRLVEVREGYARFEGEPKIDFYNPMGSIHGGYAATLLDSAMGCAVHTMLKAGEHYTTAELKMNYCRRITANTGTLSAIGTIIYKGRRIASADGKILDAEGKLYAHGSTTCAIL